MIRNWQIVDCNCHSYNGQEGEEKNKILLNPFTSKEVCIDYCIADVIQEIWDQGIHTANSCCGHGQLFPTIVIENRNDGGKIADIIKAFDKKERRWEIKAWVLTDVALVSTERDNQ